MLIQGVTQLSPFRARDLHEGIPLAWEYPAVGYHGHRLVAGKPCGTYGRGSCADCAAAYRLPRQLQQGQGRMQ